MPPEGKAIREGEYCTCLIGNGFAQPHVSAGRSLTPTTAELFRNGRVPTLEEKVIVYEEMILQIPGIHWYTRKTHLNWCLKRQQTLSEFVCPICSNHGGFSDM